MAGATFSPYKTFIAGEVLTASDLNSSITTIINNLNLAGLDDYSATTTEMRITTDPYPVGAESLATSAQGEVERLRYLIKQITGEAQWYIDPDNSLLSTTKPTYAGLTSTGAIDESYATVASHATTAPIWAATANLINYTGTEVATAFPNAPQAGARRTLICAAACGFTAGANMLINGIASASTYTAAAGDRVEVEAISTTQFKLTITKYNGTAIIGNIQIQKTISNTMATGTTTIPSDDSIPQNTEGDQYLTCTITPTSATSTLIITCQMMLATENVADYMAVALFQDNVANAKATVYQYITGSHPLIFTLNFAMVSGTTSATTFKIRAGASSAGTTTFNGVGGGTKYGGTINSSLVVMEV